MITACAKAWLQPRAVTHECNLRHYAPVQKYIIKGSLAEKLPIYEQHRRVIESLRNSRVKYNRCVIVESSTIAA